MNLYLLYITFFFFLFFCGQRKTNCFHGPHLCFHFGALLKGFKSPGTLPHNLSNSGSVLWHDLPYKTSLELEFSPDLCQKWYNNEIFKLQWLKNIFFILVYLLVSSLKLLEFDWHWIEFQLCYLITTHTSKWVTLWALKIMFTVRHCVLVAV